MGGGVIGSGSNHTLRPWAELQHTARVQVGTDGQGPGAQLRRVCKPAHGNTARLRTDPPRMAGCVVPGMPCVSFRVCEFERACSIENTTQRVDHRHPRSPPALCIPPHTSSPSPRKLSACNGIGIRIQGDTLEVDSHFNGPSDQRCRHSILGWVERHVHGGTWEHDVTRGFL